MRREGVMCDEDVNTAFGTELVCVAVVMAKGHTTLYAKCFDDGSNGATKEDCVRAETLGVGGTGGDVADVGGMGFGLSLYVGGLESLDDHTECNVHVGLVHAFDTTVFGGVTRRVEEYLHMGEVFLIFKAGAAFKEADSVCMTTVALLNFVFKIDLPFGADVREGHMRCKSMRGGGGVEETDVDGGLESCRDGDGMSLRTEDSDTRREPVGSDDKVLGAV
ncbi:hypothetical protein SARC_02714 [Sphaeroforma arctica JP610]|uniref:Uncharacterized protein n=1 Tax=Sphaeroforma arctica JP610 TaxID=667725 RepID=A0A0L0G888_9EUKA|nr:hypothetical protein SARC_02714 [Sphaeroforma arctica JP610]KNC85086.1 hypothetical protein SARC_02714 [Sphaeroforma arctica JP610]|eukprot:XP_014158988.1 hypothetical protein SARC_02714 [Sphaeroforma arctica JP610]